VEMTNRDRWVTFFYQDDAHPPYMINILKRRELVLLIFLQAGFGIELNLFVILLAV
jgi:hypothetical protein